MQEVANLINAVTELLNQLGSYLSLLIGFLLGILSFLVTTNPKIINQIRGMVNIKITGNTSRNQDENYSEIIISYELANGSNLPANFNVLYVEFNDKKVIGNSPFDETSLYHLMNPTIARL